MNNYNLWTDEHLSFLKENLENYTYVELSKIMTGKFDRVFTPSILAAKARLSGLKKSANKIKWTDEIDAFIKDKYRDATGKRLATLIGERFGVKVTANSVLCRIRGKLKLTMNGTGKHTRKMTSSKVKIYRDDTTVLNSGIRLLEATNKHCLYMTSPSAESHVCGELRVNGSSFCDHHHDLCYIPIKSKTVTDSLKVSHIARFNSGDFARDI